MFHRLMPTTMGYEIVGSRITTVRTVTTRNPERLRGLYSWYGNRRRIGLD